MTFLEPQCDHEKIGRVLAHSYSTAANAVHILEYPGRGKIDGLNLDQWRNIQANYRDQMDANLEHHRATCEKDKG